jgi:hypothetical protein
MSLRISYRRTESPLSKSERQTDLVLDGGEDFDGDDGRSPYPWDRRNPPISLCIAYHRQTWYCTVVRTLTVMMVMGQESVTLPVETPLCPYALPTVGPRVRYLNRKGKRTRY